MRKRRYKKYINVCIATILISTECIPVYALEKKVKDQLAAMKSLVELDFEANAMSISILLDQCLDMLSDDEPIKSTLQSVKLLLAAENSNSTAITVLLDTILEEANDGNKGYVDGNQENVKDATTKDGSGKIMGSENIEDIRNDSMVFPEIEAFLLSSTDLELPVFEVEDYEQTHIPSSILVDVPSDWGNNAAGGRSLISYSPVNASGAINPKAGTLTISYFSMESDDIEETFANYEKSIADMSVTSEMRSEDVSASNLPAKKLNFLMSVGANQFTCETVCFIYEETVYSIELLQGQQASYNYFPVFGQVVQSTEIALDDNTAENVMDIEAVVEPENTLDTEEIVGSENIDESNGGDETEIHFSSENGDISSFIYQINGHEYQFPTPVSEINPDDIYIDRQLYLPYDIYSDADMEVGSWTEIINTEYFYFESSLYKEMTGITNMTGYDTNLSEGIVTALIDTNGSYLDIVLPGNIHVGSSESDILNGFPAFKNQQMNGNAQFVNNEYLYACNVRDDGCNGYVIVRNDDPFYSAVSIICEDAVIKEISFECLGSERAAGVFEEVI